MKIRQIMSQPAATCRQDESLEAAARLMWEQDCGAIPVTGEGGKLVGILTDRDICMAVCLQGRRPGEIAIRESMAERVVTCRPDQPIDQAESLMAEHQVRRLPVVDEEGRPVGLLSVNDIARHASLRRERVAMARETVRTMAAIGRHRSGVLVPSPPAAESPAE